MTSMPVSYQLFVGVDIAATSFTTSWTTDLARTTRPATFEQRPHGFQAFQPDPRAVGFAQQHIPERPSYELQITA